MSSRHFSRKFAVFSLCQLFDEYKEHIIFYDCEYSTSLKALLPMQPFHCNGKVSVFVQDFSTDLFYQGDSACIQPSLATSFATSLWFPPFYPVLKSSLRKSRGQSRFHKSIFHLAIQSWIRNIAVSQQRKSGLYPSPTGIIFSKKT